MLKNSTWPLARPPHHRLAKLPMNVALPAEGKDLSPYLPDEHGLFFIYHFKAGGSRTKDPTEAHWTWRSYQITDMRARQEIGAEQALPGPVREALLSPSHGCQIDFEDDFLFGELPDLRHNFAEARGLPLFRFPFNETVLVGARKQPLESVDKIRKLVESGARKFRT